MPCRITRIEPRSYGLPLHRCAGPEKNVDVFPVEALIEAVDAKIKPGMTAEVRIHLDRKPKVVALPIESVRSEDGKSFVTQILAGDKGPERRRVEVKLGVRNDREVEVVTGIAPGDRVLIEPASSEKNETKI